jgi:pyridoxine/pyridoxamine 5'-phosphate oxidase
VVYEVPPDAGGFVLILDDVEFWEDKSARFDLGTLPARA